MKSKMKFLRRFKLRTATLNTSADSPRRELSAGVLNVTVRGRNVGFRMKLLLSVELPGLAWSSLDLPGPAWTCLDLPGLAWTCLDLPGDASSCRDVVCGLDMVCI